MPRRRRGRRSRDEDARCGDALARRLLTGVFQAGHVVFNVVYLSGLRPIVWKRTGRSTTRSPGTGFVADAPAVAVPRFR